MLSNTGIPSLRSPWRSAILRAWNLTAHGNSSQTSGNASSSRSPTSASSDPDGEGERTEPGDEASEDLYQDEFDAGRAEDFKAQLAALERAEERLAAGTYGLSIESGEPIPDERLEVVPTAERTVEEEAAG